MSDILDEINKEYDAQARKIDRQIAKAAQNKINNKKKETLNKFKKIGLVSGSVIALGLAAYAGWSAHEAYEVSQGEKIISNNFKYDDYVGQTECSEHGFDYSIGNTSVSYDEVISYLRQNVEDNGYNDVQAYITLKRNFKGSVADEVVGRDISKEEINKEAKKAYENGIVDTKEEGVSHGR